MNIFITSKCPIESAKLMDDKRLIKMCLESAQILSTVLYEYGYKKAYRPCYQNHPATKWTQKSRGNYKWVLDHFKALCDEYTYRFGKIHKSSRLYGYFKHGLDSLPEGDLTNFYNGASNKSLGISFKHLQDVPKAYKLYLMERWKTDKREPKWTNRQEPDWR